MDITRKKFFLIVICGILLYGLPVITLCPSYCTSSHPNFDSSPDGSCPFAFHSFVQIAVFLSALFILSPAGFFLVMPSLFIAVMRGPRRLKSTALAMLVYWALIALIVAWRPGNAHLMTPFFVCSGFFMAFALPPWRLGRNGRLLLQILGIMIMAHAILA